MITLVLDAMIPSLEHPNLIIMVFFLSRYSSNSTKTTISGGQITEEPYIKQKSGQELSSKNNGDENIDQKNLNIDHYYTIQSGDTLSNIAKKYYDDSNSYSVLAEENNIENPHLIFPEQTIRIPDLEDSFELKNN